MLIRNLYKTLWNRVGSDLLISMLEKLNWFHETSLINTGAIDVKMDGSALGGK